MATFFGEKIIQLQLVASKMFFYLILKWKANRNSILSAIDKVAVSFFEQVKLNRTKSTISYFKPNRHGLLNSLLPSGLCPVHAEYVIKYRVFTRN